MWFLIVYMDVNMAWTIALEAFSIWHVTGSHMNVLMHELSSM